MFLAVINLYYHSILHRIKNKKRLDKLQIFSIAQVLTDLIVFIFLSKIISVGFFISVLYILPIIFVAFIFGTRWAIAAAFASIILINGFGVFHYYNYLTYGIFSESLPAEKAAELRNLTFSLIETLSISGMYIVVAVFFGNIVNLFLQREEGLIKESKELEKISEYRENEWKQLEKTTKLLVKRENELDKKVKDLERSEKSMISIFRDLREEKEKTVREKNKTVAIVSNFVDPIIVINSKNEIDLVNPSAKQVFGLKEDVLGRVVSAENNYSMDNFKEFISHEYKVVKGKELKNSNSLEEEVVIDFMGHNHTYKVITAEVVDNKNAKIGTMKIFNNLTREKILDKLKSDFISIAAHQLRTPLSAIKWSIKMVLDGDYGKLNTEQEGMLFKGYRSNERIIELVNDMLDVSRIEEGRFGYSFDDADFLNELNFVIDSLSQKIKEKNIKFVLEAPKKIPKLFMDKQKMVLVLQNLVENAVKYTPDHGRVRVSVERGNEFIKVIVEDNGVGIPILDQGKMFSKFFRARNVMRMQTEGSGLGLFIVKNIIKKHGGEITFESKEGVGTKFVFTLPLKKEKIINN